MTAWMIDVEILEGSGSTTVAQLVSNMTNPIAYVDAATMMRGVGAGMPIKATKPDVVHLPGGCVAPDQDRKRSRAVRIAITAGGASLAIFTALWASSA